ncbi:MAG: ferritin [bacterium]|nr:ferritin [bacterium]
MLNEEIDKALGKHLNAEIYSSHLYYSMSAYFESLGLKGFSHWLRIQALEELGHVQKFFDYVHERGGRLIMRAVDAPPHEWESPLAAFEAVYEHEVHVSTLINGLMDLAIARSDHASVNFLQWFIGEQVEEESTADEVVQKLRLVDDAKGGLFLLDQEMDKRTFVALPELIPAF